MRCDEVKESIVDVIYDESGKEPESSEIREHLRTCASCRAEFEEMAQTRKYLQRWEDEPPLRHIAIEENNAFPGKNTLPYRPSGWKYMRYAAIAAMVLITILALANTHIAWNKDGFTFSTRLFASQAEERDYYTKTELRNLLKEVLDDSESRTNEIIYLMMQETLKTVEQDRWMDLNLIRSSSIQNQTN
jgi:predicted anti-sigma-YlaC factor YlaD